MNIFRHIILIFFLQRNLVSAGEDPTIDSLKKILEKRKEDTNTVHTLNRLSQLVGQSNNNIDGRYYADQALILSKKLKSYRGQTDALQNIAHLYIRQNNLTEARNILQKAFKSMLQHSGSSSGKKKATDINALADEYLRLAYHGMRAKDKSFAATTKTQFDNNPEKIGVVPQDIGRLILNLINNSFYAVAEKRNQNHNGYEPVVAVTTKKENGKVEITVRDNGNGIPQKVLDKIFQPFFTTKPTGQGTGLDLSLSYDIVKAHGGQLKVETKEGEGAAFIIQIPMS